MIFVTTNGIAAGLVSMDVGVREDPGTRVDNQSLQRTGEGCQSTDFVWTTTPQADTQLEVNIGQKFQCDDASTSPMDSRAWINEFQYDNR